jgi:hypothetical protein
MLSPWLWLGVAAAVAAPSCDPQKHVPQIDHVSTTRHHADLSAGLVGEDWVAGTLEVRERVQQLCRA